MVTGYDAGHVYGRRANVLMLAVVGMVSQAIVYCVLCRISVVPVVFCY